jgi:type VI secretion system protein ImpJ
MTINNRVVWSEGLFLRPQHFQQQERYLERHVELRASVLRAHGWGFTELEFERDLLATGKLALRRARGVFPDGTPFSMPDDDPLPPALEMPASVRDRTIYLAMPLRRAGAVEIAATGETREVTRLQRVELEVRDNAGVTDEPALLEVAAINARLLVEGEPTDEFACIPGASSSARRTARCSSTTGSFQPSPGRRLHRSSRRSCASSTACCTSAARPWAAGSPRAAAARPPRSATT